MMTADRAEMPVTAHLQELRKRLIYSFLAMALGTGISLCFIREVIAFLTAPAGQLYFARPAEVVIIYCKVAVMTGFLLASPIVFFEFWRFILPALTDKERTWTCFFVPLSVTLFLSGVGFSYFFVMPESLHFLMAFGGEDFKPLLSMENYLEFVLFMIFPFGIVCNVPLVLIALAKAGLVSSHGLGKGRKYVIFLSFVLSAVITPTPDIMTQCFLAVPSIVLFELSLGIIRMMGK